MRAGCLMCPSEGPQVAANVAARENRSLHGESTALYSLFIDIFFFVCSGPLVSLLCPEMYKALFYRLPL